ncbi:MAG TPA: threonylcarbamoyl-AMP synthase [Candidatus Onthocola stercorigallinarum]|nr:threonylcarbamoyl-AMP synthase [Candidatus Onthocola stercorigallinarum]
MKVFDWTNKINEDELKIVTQALNEGKLIVFPTETVYGIAGNGLTLSVIDKMYQAKKRDYSKPFTLMVNDITKIKDIAYVSENEEKVIKKFMPGPITLILKKKDCISNLVTANSDTVGVRIPNHEIALSILKSVDYPLATSSANISGSVNNSNIEDIINDLENYVDIFIKGNISSNLLASTVVEIKNNEVNILRNGIISKENIEEVIRK